MPPSNDPNSPQTNTLGFDEFIGIFVAFLTIGAILFWSFSRKDADWNFNGLMVSPTSSAAPTPQVGTQPNNRSNTNVVPLPLPTPAGE